MSRKPEIPIRKLDKDTFVELATGEVKEFKHTDRRADNLTTRSAGREMSPMAKKKGTIPKHELEALAEVLFPTMKDYLTSSEGKVNFECTTKSHV